MKSEGVPYVNREGNLSRYSQREKASKRERFYHSRADRKVAFQKYVPVVKEEMCLKYFSYRPVL